MRSGPPESKDRLRRLSRLAVLGGCVREQAAETLVGRPAGRDERGGFAEPVVVW